MITEIEDFFARGCGRCARFDTPDCSTRLWIDGLVTLRGLCLSLGLSEVVKWGHPCYMHAGRNIAVMGAFRGDFRLSFFDAALLTDPEGALQRQGPNTRHPDALRFTAADQVAARAPVILSLLRQAMALAEAGARPSRPMAGAPDLPADLAAALQADPDLAAAFHRLTPGRQRSHVLALASAKTPETRLRRIAAQRGRILSGKGATER
ncbi:MAG: YdeI/OmpD-associated family protein [Fuscovulum sp.]|nr:YdeI/OmpD-associated family protein [Fuscovulum sp.]